MHALLLAGQAQGQNFLSKCSFFLGRRQMHGAMKYPLLWSALCTLHCCDGTQGSTPSHVSSPKEAFSAGVQAIVEIPRRSVHTSAQTAPHVVLQGASRCRSLAKAAAAIVQARIQIKPLFPCRYSVLQC